MASLTDECPAHGLGPDTTVLVDGLPYTARLVCETWHDTAQVRATLRRVVSETLQQGRGTAFWSAQRVA